VSLGSSCLPIRYDNARALVARVLRGRDRDRLTLRAHILETGAASYRLRTSQAKRKEAPPAA